GAGSNPPHQGRGHIMLPTQFGKEPAIFYLYFQGPTGSLYIYRLFMLQSKVLVRICIALVCIFTFAFW
ncbi:hypothetical protein M1N69_01345, partial [Thermodesulfovibrionales bacterium]|nr:hypothetical protein [Thermodesulfovibrionales bacterium]